MPHSLIEWDWRFGRLFCSIVGADCVELFQVVQQLLISFTVSSRLIFWPFLFARSFVRVMTFLYSAVY